MPQPDVGSQAPDFSLPSDGGGRFSLSGHKGKPVVLFFYPKDDTSGCTAEALDFTANRKAFGELGVIVAGMSPDPVGKHVRFRDKHNLDVPLISDEEKTALQAYGVWREKSMYGRKYMGVERSTFLIDENGTVVRAWRNVKVPGHVDEVLAAARELLTG